jgi:Domain of unknown function (DUF4404)
MVNPETLKKTLAALHEELSRAPALDEQSRQLLRELMNDVEGLRSSPASAPPAMRRHRMEALAIGFEAQHPNLAAGLRQLMDLLAKAGL